MLERKETPPHNQTTPFDPLVDEIEDANPVAGTNHCGLKTGVNYLEKAHQ